MYHHQPELWGATANIMFPADNVPGIWIRIAKEVLQSHRRCMNASPTWLFSRFISLFSLCQCPRRLAHS